MNNINSKDLHKWKADLNNQSYLNDSFLNQSSLFSYPEPSAKTDSNHGSNKDSNDKWISINKSNLDTNIVSLNESKESVDSVSNGPLITPIASLHLSDNNSSSLHALNNDFTTSKNDNKRGNKKKKRHQTNYFYKYLTKSLNPALATLFLGTTITIGYFIGSNIFSILFRLGHGSSSSTSQFTSHLINNSNNINELLHNLLLNTNQHENLNNDNLNFLLLNSKH
ncbi:uncharacterized protein ASCRUDRAFT_75139 [Ascoidea rubescens DSM 1968]|uniref:Uncharacterized protein n=1 Tax=Ascoidea rubescens DSM 1968 TaxID=1344418 RepID=A0A1D2VJT4_9ASCO|nr:hypothetical protein ASCRUDRAFT_75139 [Ascoidea rubescens DSM 1968]ODV61874.1 hypothetical protein ASCRUDRAFT_75139 [Ascoidea rubescens DSM 1968]